MHNLPGWEMTDVLWKYKRPPLLRNGGLVHARGTNDQFFSDALTIVAPLSILKNFRNSYCWPIEVNRLSDETRALRSPAVLPCEKEPSSITLAVDRSPAR